MSTWLAIRPLTDPAVDNSGYDARSAYAEMFWLPVIGPTALLLLRHLAGELDRHPEGVHLPVADTAQRLGIGNREGNQSPVRRSLQRLVQFNLAEHLGGAAYAVRTMLPLVALHHAQRLPDSVRMLIPRWHEPRTQADALARARERARRIAALLTLEGASTDQVERAIAARGIHPAVCFEAARWAQAELQRSAEPESEHVA